MIGLSERGKLGTYETSRCRPLDGKAGQSRYKSKRERVLKEQRKKVSRLSFGDEGDGMVHGAGIGIRNPASAVKDAAVTAAHWKTHEEEDENAAVEGAHRAELAGESLARKSIYMRERLKGRREESRRLKESVLDEAERSRLIFETAYGNEAKDAVKREAEKKKKSALQKLFQKKRYQKQYQAARQSKKVKDAAITSAQKFTEKAKDAVKMVAAQNRGIFATVAVFALIFVLIAASFTSCTASLQGASSAIISTSYSSTDEDIYAAENAYRALEEALNTQINQMESTHPDYDEYRYQIDEIGHNPYQLISYLTVKYGGFTYDEVAEESCIVSWCLGHLAEYAQPEEYDPKYEKWQFDDLPILPQVWKLKVSRDKKKQFDVLKSLMNRADVDYLVNGCDAGREGELIFQRVYDLAGCRKPVKRLWISSMEDTAIRTGFQTMKGAEEYRNICMAAVCRAQADWLIGMNGTRAYTTCYFKRLVVGRVQTPTLAMLAERQDKIEHFQKEAFYKVALTDGRLTVVSENIANEEAADLLASLCMDSEAVITQIKREQKKAFPPKLYDLTSLQREANRYFGYTAKKTLDMLQELYEEKLVTYPRTDSQFVTEDMRDTVEELVGKMPVLLPFLDYGQLGHNITRVINNAKVSDHHAILPTKEAVEKGISDLTADKKNLMMLVCQQLVQATGEEYQYEQTDIMVKCQGHDFTARGKVPVQMGFKAAGNAFKNQCVKAKPEEETEKETSIPYGYEEGMTLSPVKAEKTVHFTSPPKPFNEDTLLAAMETAGNKDFDSETEKKGLGTPATRAGIIEKLVSSGYAVRKGKQILPSTEGRELVNVMPAYLKSAAMTAEWENQLLMMEKGQITDTQFMGEITSLVGKILSVCREIPETERRRFQKAREVIGKCPVCGSDVYEGKQNFYCSNRQCDFALWKENRFLGSMEKNLDKKMARELLDKACTHVKGLYSKKKDMKFDADLLLTLEDGKPRFHLEFPKKKKK